MIFPIRINYILLNTEYMTILYFYHNFHVFVIRFCISINSGIYSSLDTFFYRKNISISVKRSNLTLVISKAACNADPGAARKRARSSSYISRNIFQKFSNVSANNNVLLKHINHAIL